MLTLPAPTMLSTRIPFAGFYESIWSNAFDQEETSLYEHWDENIKYDRDRLEMDFPCFEGVTSDIIREMLQKHGYDVLQRNASYRSMYQALAGQYAEAFVWWLTDSLDLWTTGPIETVDGRYPFREREAIAFEYEEMTSPKFYNFETDRIFIKLSLSVYQTILDRLNDEQPTAVWDIFRKMFTSRSGFVSFYGNTPPTVGLEHWDHNQLYALLTAWVDHKTNRIDDELYENLYEEVSRIFSDNIDWTEMASDMEEHLVEYLDEQGILPEDIPPPRCKHTLELPFM